MSKPIVQIKGLKNKFGDEWVHKDVNLDIQQGEMLAIIGGSGSGKTTILRSILMLQTPTEGQISVFGQDLDSLDEDSGIALRRRWGMLFQHSALFSAMTVLENIMFPMFELAHLDKALAEELALLKITLVGLPKEAAWKYPSQLSGGMLRRAAAARAIAMDPELLFLDEPTSGLDPASAQQFDDLILFLKKTLNLTVVVVTHDIDSLRRTTDRVAFIGDGKVLAIEPIKELMKNPHPLIVEYFKHLQRVGEG